MYRQQPQKDILGLQSESYLSRAYHKAKRAALVGTAAFLAYFGLGASSQAPKIPAAYRAPLAARQAHSAPEISYLVAEYPRPKPAVSKKYEPNQEPAPQPDPKQQEKDLEAKAKESYAKATDSDAWKAKGYFPPERLELCLEAFQAYTKAEAADPSSNKYEYQLKHLSSFIPLNALWVIKEEKDSAKTNALYERLSKYEGKDFDFFPFLSGEKNKALIDEILDKHGIQHKPYSKPKAPTPQDPTITPQPDKPKPQEEPKKQDDEKSNPYSADRIAANAEAGSRKSTQDRSASLDVKVGGFQVIAHGAKNKFREATSRDKVIAKEFGAYAGIDFDRIFGVPLEFSASFDERTVTRDSFDFGETDSPSFNIKTFTDTTTEESMRYLAARAAFDFREFKLGVTGFNKLLTTDVDVLTRLEVINKSDPSGNYTDFITNNPKFETDILGGQFSLEVPVSDRFSMGTLATLEFTDMEDFNRDIDLYRFHLFGKYRSANGRFGINALVGEALLDDSGEDDDGWKKGEYNLVAAYQLSDSFLLGGRFTYLTNPRGSLFFLFGKNEGALDALLEQYWQEGMADIDLLKHMSEEQQKDYILGRRRDLVRGLADHNSLMLLGDLGAARVNRPMEGESVEFNGRVTLFIPIDDFTLTVTPYIDNADLYRRFGLELTGQKKGSRWSFGVDVAKEEDFSGHLEEEEDIRGMFWARYALGPGKK